MATGYLPQLEDRSFLDSGTAGNFSAPASFAAPPSFSLRDALVVEDQGNMNSCVGHGASSGVECLQFLKSRTRKPMSRMFAYLTAQQQTNINRDQGATIAGAAAALSKAGCCFEETFPYPSRYNRSIPSPATQEASKYRILGHRTLTTYEEILGWQQTGKGPVLAGTIWTQRLANNSGTLVTPADLKGPVIGAHCTLFIGWNEDGTLDELNSHGTRWGQQGWASWTPEAIAAVLRLRDTVFIGITDITGFDETRLYDFRAII